MTLVIDPNPYAMFGFAIFVLICMSIFYICFLIYDHVATVKLVVDSFVNWWESWPK
jgi:hypothetical protein